MVQASGVVSSCRPGTRVLAAAGMRRWRLACLVVVAACAAAQREAVPPPLPAPPPEPLAAGFVALANGRFERAAEAFAAVGARHPALADYGLYFAARAAARAGDVDRARAAVAALLGTQPDSLWRGPAVLLAGELAARAGHLDDARAHLDAARATLPAGDVGWARATLALARLEAERGDPARALALADEIRRARPRALADRRARRLEARTRAAHPELPPSDALAEAELRLREGDASRAREYAERALAAPGERAPALWALAQAERALGDRAAAETACRALAAEAPGHPLAPRALTAAAAWHWNADDDPGAALLFEDVVRRWPRSREAPEALYALGRIAQESGRLDDAHALYRRLVREYPGAKPADEAAWRAGWVRWLAGRWDDAAARFADAAARGDGTARAAAAYWRARALERAGRRGEAGAVLRDVAAQQPVTYYARLAEQRLGRAVPAGEPPATPPQPVFPPALDGPRGLRARLLADLGFTGFARRELDGIDPAAVPGGVLLDAYAALGAPSAAIRVARRLDGAGTSDETIRRHLYPLGYWDVVRRAAHAHGVDPFLVVALIRQESLFDPAAVSVANARGLMQLLPATAAELRRAAGAPRPPLAALHDPSTNVDLGVTLLARLLARYEGSPVKALAAYNAGGDAVAKWERRYAGRDDDEFVELISYRETRDYVKAVLRNERVYRELWAVPESASASSRGRPPNAPFDMTAITSPAWPVASR
jgi:soluble lytic murein transglycosylase